MANPEFKIIRIGRGKGTNREQAGSRESRRFRDPEFPPREQGRRRAQEGTTIRGEAFLRGGRVETFPKKDVYRIKKTRLGYTWLPLYRTRVTIAEWNMGFKIWNAARVSRRVR